MSRYYSNGKLLITGEYVVLDGAKALAVPTKYGQDLTVKTIQEPQIVWRSFTCNGECWFEAVFDLPKIRLTQANFNSNEEGGHEQIAETLQDLLREARKLNPEFLNTQSGYMVTTNLSFPRDWGLGSSSTLINNIAQWANIDPFTLLWNAFSGSGYDIACAKNDSPILFRNSNNEPHIATVDFNPSFANQLFFVHLNQKQNSREGIQQYRKFKDDKDTVISRITDISLEILKAQSIEEFERLILEHEELISSVVGVLPIKQKLFPDYFGQIKSLGAWGGDFILATGNELTPMYFKQRGYLTTITYSDMIL